MALKISRLVANRLARDGDSRASSHDPAGSPPTDTCPFCPAVAFDRYERISGTVAAFRDGFPVTEGHYLVVPLRHTPNFFEMTPEERQDTDALLVELAAQIRAMDPLVSGFNIGMNCGDTAGQTIGHAHTHLIPRRAGDTPAPRGGVRGVIPARMNY
jgi:ATP adenylyltransferase